MPDEDSPKLSLDDPRSAETSQRVSPWASLLLVDFRLLFIGSALANFGLQMRQFANVWQVYEISHSPLQLGLTGLFQAIPIFGLGLFAGTLVDIFDRRKLLIISQVFNLVLALILGLLTASGVIQVWHIFAMTTLTSVVNVLAQPTRTTLVSSLVPRSHLMNGITLISASQQIMILIGPFIAGLAVGTMGAASAYFINAIIFVPVLISLFMMKTPPRDESVERAKLNFRMMTEGLKFVWQTQIILVLITLDTIATLFGAYRSLMPVFAKDILFVGPAGLGLLMSAPALGALSGMALLLALGNVSRKGLLVILSTTAFGIMLIVFGVSKWYALSFIAAGSLGFLDSMGVSARQTSVQLLTPDHLRGRATSILQVFAMGAPSFGIMLAGGVASVIGAESTLVMGGVVCAVSAVLIGAIAGGVRNYRS